MISAVAGIYRLIQKVLYQQHAPPLMQTATVTIGKTCASHATIPLSFFRGIAADVVKERLGLVVE